MIKKKKKHDVFKGREARLNLAIFTVLSISGPLPEFKIYKYVIKQPKLNHYHEGAVYKRLRRLSLDGYLDELPPKSGSRAKIYELKDKARLALVLRGVTPQELINRANEIDAKFLIEGISRIVASNESS